MKIMTCPMNGPRNIDEFTSYGPVHERPDMDASSDGEWIGYLFFHDNRAGVIREWWRHDPSNYFFIAERETVTDEIVRTYAAGELAAQETKP